jgi:EAL domain-containing protein (putative c-di-GMP-specific phosphodiesterase class I)
VSPSEFIPVAESSGLIVDLGLWILRESCRQGRAWLDAGFPARSISVNVSPAQFWNMDFETAVSAVLAETGFPPSLLCLELTESLFVDQSEHRISRTLSALAGLGVHLALDDFGSGYSSLGYLTRLPFDRLKVDRSFVDGIATRPDKRKLLGGIIALSRGLGMTVIAEGAERPAEVDVLAELGCDIVQGYVFSRPVVPEVAPVVAASIERETLRRIAIQAPMDERAVFAAAPVGV